MSASPIRRSTCPAFLNWAVLVAGDLMAFLVSAFLGDQLVHWFWPDSPSIWHLTWHPLGLYGLLAAVAIGRFWLRGHYGRRRPFWDELGEVSTTVAGLAVLYAALSFMTFQGVPRAWLGGTWVTALVLAPLARFLGKEVLRRVGCWQVPAVVIGTGTNAEEAVQAFRSEALLGYTVEAFLDPDAQPGEELGPKRVNGDEYPVQPLGKWPEATIRQFGNPHVVIALDQGQVTRLQKLVESLSIQFHEVSVVPALRGLPMFGMEARHFFSHEVLMLQVRNNLARFGPRVLKRLADILGGLLFLALFSPLFAVLAVLIKRDGGPVFFSHSRVGRNGEAFPCYKFRSMVPNAQEVLQELLDNDPEARAEWERDFKLKNDPRVTKVGNFLRKTSLDELPQLFNVIRGEMSLVGPRPIVEEELEKYGEYAVYYKEAKPGMTGLWQVSGRSDTDYDERVYLDSWYVKNWSLWYDMVILLRTAAVVFLQRGAY